MTDSPSTAWENRLQYDLIEPEAFQIVENQRLPKTTTPFLIESALQGFSVTLGQLARLLGTDRSHASDWRNGRKRLSAAYSGRLLHLWNLQNEGLPLNMAHHIHWRTGTIEWTNGNTSRGNHRLAEGWESGPEPRKANKELINWGNDGPGPSVTEPSSSNK
jgi:DNA-binding transcriptional regulator YiaG